MNSERIKPARGVLHEWMDGSELLQSEIDGFEAAVRADVATDVLALVVAARAVLKWGTEDSDPVPATTSIEALEKIIGGDAEFDALKDALAPFEHVGEGEGT